MSFFERLSERFPDLSFEQEVLLAPFTTVKIGGPAEVFTRIKKRSDLEGIISFCFAQEIPITILGWGANTLIADRGLRGLVIKNETNQILVHPDLPKTIIEPETVTARWNADDAQGSKKYEFTDLDFDESESDKVLVTLDSGVSLPLAINVLLNQGITGLQWYSRIPASVGGAIYNNIHGGTHFISEVVQQVSVVTKQGELKNIPVTELAAGYDTSRFHSSGEQIISADFLLFKGDVTKAKSVAQEWAKRKKIQPQNSLGCVFQNISDEDQKRRSLPTPSIGYIIEHSLGLQGFSIGDAIVSPHHAAFIENKGAATAVEYLTVIRTIIDQAQEELGILLKPEIFFLGFTREELHGIVSA